MPGTRSSFTFLRGSPHGLAELLPLVSIMFVYTQRQGAGAVDATAKAAFSGGQRGPKAGHLTVVWIFPLPLPSRSLLFFLAGATPLAVTAAIVHSETRSSILMKQRTSSVHFNCQQVGNGQSASLLTSYLTEQRASANESATVADKLNFKKCSTSDKRAHRAWCSVASTQRFLASSTVTAADVT